MLFILFFTVDKVALKPVALFAAGLFLIKTIKKEDLRNAPLFYIILPLLGLVNLFFFHQDFSSGRLISFSIGTIYWLMAFAAFIAVKVRIRDIGLRKTENTITVFFILNLLVSIYQLIHVIYISGTINPYSSELVEFGNSTGDYIQGVFLAPCYINMFVSCAFTVYFLYKRKYLLSFLAAALAFITTSNFANVIFLLVLLVLFVVLNVKKARLTILFQLAFGTIFYLFVSYGNLSYFASSFTTKSKDTAESSVLKSIALNDVKKDPVAPPKNSANTKAKAKVRQAKEDSIKRAETIAVLKQMNDGEQIVMNDKEFGKLISLKQTKNFLESGTSNFLFGAGVGAFSSQLALRTSDIPVKNGSRLFARAPRYVSPDFKKNHYQVFSTIYQMGPEYHSIRHLPNSELNHIPGEYGVMGLIAFLVFYVGFFLKRAKRATYSILIGLMMGYFLLFDYVFEYLSLVLFFEIFFLTDLKRNEEKSLE